MRLESSCYQMMLLLSELFDAHRVLIEEAFSDIVRQGILRTFPDI